MSEPIRNADAARRFWEARFAVHVDKMLTDSHIFTDYRVDVYRAERRADHDLDIWAERFADAETVRDIEENKTRRGVE